MFLGEDCCEINWINTSTIGLTWYRMSKAETKILCCSCKILLKIRFRLLKKWELLGVIKKRRKPCSTIPLMRENKFDLFDSIRLETLRFELSWHQKRMSFTSNKRSKAVVNIIFTKTNISTNYLSCLQFFQKKIWIEFFYLIRLPNDLGDQSKRKNDLVIECLRQLWLFLVKRFLKTNFRAPKKRIILWLFKISW